MATEETTTSVDISQGSLSEFLQGAIFTGANRDKLKELSETRQKANDKFLDRETAKRKAQIGEQLLRRSRGAGLDEPDIQPLSQVERDIFNASHGPVGEEQELLGLQAKSKESGGLIQRALTDLEAFTTAGPGAEDVARGTEAQRGLAAILGDLAETGFRPTEQDISFGSEVSGTLFAEQRLRLDQSFTRQGQETSQLAARLGRATDDPILQSKLRTGFLQEQAALQARQGALGQQLALLQPEQRLQLKQNEASVLSGLSQQAFANKQSLIGISAGVLGQQQGFELATATQNQVVKQSLGGVGIFGAIAGGIGALAGGVGSVATGFGGGK